VIGCNLILGPDVTLSLANQGFLSPDGLCYSFDHRANGFARGEGVIAMLFKPLSKAIQDGDMIRAVVRGTGSNSDGHTPGLTQPSAEAQERLIRHVYTRAGLDYENTRYFEAHGTGTPTGDPIEMRAIGRVFRNSRSTEEPLYVGSIKSNVGHLEGGAGLAGIVKSILILEKGIIPPNALFEKLNPDIDADFYHTQVPTKSITWPSTGVRRVSVNSFGMGGTNAHVVLDDAYSFLLSAGLSGNHQCDVLPQAMDEVMWSSSSSAMGSHLSLELSASSDEESPKMSPTLPDIATAIHKSVPYGALSSAKRKLLVWSAADETAVDRVSHSLKQYHASTVLGSSTNFERLAFTLASRRSHLKWRAFAVLNGSDPEAELTPYTKPARSSLTPGRLGFVFTGQGAQYAEMGIELLEYDIFKKTLSRFDAIFAELGAGWSLLDAIQDKDKINRPEYSQPLCTVLQVGLVELLKQFEVSPAAVVGHSSGEIAAAYTIGALSLEQAAKVAFYRGKLTEELKSASASQIPGAMMSVNLTLEEALAYISETSAELGEETFPCSSVHVACVNSQLNCTLSGAESSIDILKERLDKKGTFAQKVNTGVAYHSPAMEVIADRYLELLRPVLESPETDGKRPKRSTVSMISSVTGKAIKAADLCKAQYWVDNLVSRVNFLEAVSSLALGRVSTRSGHALEANAADMTDLVEIGPHPALRRPVQDILKGLDGTTSQDKSASKARYYSVLARNKSPVQSSLELIGQLFSHGFPVSIAAANRQQEKPVNPIDPVKTSLKFSPLVNIPSYPFDHSHTYWLEPRASVGYRFPRTVEETLDGSTELLGKPVPDFNQLDPRWRNIVSADRLPWVADHIVNRLPVLAGTCILTMAIEAAKQHFEATKDNPNRSIAGYAIKEARFLSPVLISKLRQGGTETMLHLRPTNRGSSTRDRRQSEIKVFTSTGHERWNECFRCTIQVQDEQEASADFNQRAEEAFERQDLQSKYEQAVSACDTPIDSGKFYKFCDEFVEITYLDTFAILNDMKWDGGDMSLANISLAASAKSPKEYPLHPVGAIIDASLHMVAVQLSKGLTQPSDTIVLASLADTWVSSKIFDRPSSDSASIRVMNVLDKDNSKTRAFSTVCGLSDDGSVLFKIGKVEMSKVTDLDEAAGSEGLKDVKKLLHGIEWQPQLSLMSKDQLDAYMSGLSTGNKDEEFMVEYYPKIEKAMTTAARKALRDASVVGEDVLKAAPSYVSRLVESLRHHYVKDEAAETEELLSDQELEQLLSQCDEELDSWRLFPAVARNLKGIIRGETNPVDVFFSSGLAENFYASLFNSVCDNRFKAFLELAVHENPRLRILEVGAGTGGMTQEVLSAFRDITSRKGTSCFSEYTYTDISPGFFEAAREKFGEFEDRMLFRKLDLEKDSHEDEGFELGGYDLILAGSVLHATVDLSKTMKNVRQLLKPGGYLMALEMVSQTSACGNVGFGSLEGWWLSKEDWRSQSPLLNESQWDGFLKEVGFSGNLLTIRDYASDVPHIASIIVSQRSEDAAQPLIPARVSEMRPYFVVNDNSSTQLELANALRSQEGWSDPGAQIITWSDIEQDNESIVSTIASDKKAVFVSLLETDQYWLANVPEASFATLQKVMSSVRKILWVTSAGVDKAEYPFYGTMNGFLRSVRAEDSSRHIVSLEINSVSAESSAQGQAAIMAEMAEHIATVLGTSFSSAGDELELRVTNGIFNTPRLVEETELNSSVRSLVSPSLRTEPWLSGSAVELAVEAPGLLDSFKFVEDHKFNQHAPLDPHDIEIEAKAWPISFRDLLIALGRMDYETPGLECAGVVTRVGSAVGREPHPDGFISEAFKPGDRVVLGMANSGAMRTYPRSMAANAHRIPDDMSFETAVSAINPAMTVWYGLIYMARLEKGEKILIHSAAGATGQTALRVAKMIGAEVFATVGNEDKKKFLVEEFGIPEDHIFSSRGVSFAEGIKRMTKTGVDVLFNSLSGDSLLKSWECMAPFGRFVEIGKADIHSNSNLPMSMFAGNISFMAIDLYHCFYNNRRLFYQIRKGALDLLHEGKIQGPMPLHCLPMSNAEGAFRLMQSGKAMGRIILTSSPDDQVVKYTRNAPDWRFKPDASYLVAGGLGGIGRAILRWMAGQGAKNLLILSRSGLSSASEAAVSAVSELREQGIRVEVLSCDVSSLPVLSESIAEISKTMPPIKGCINAAMVLKDAVFENMTHQMWQTTLNSKINTSWNLHQVLPVGSLDFFVFLSSVAGVYGSISQSNYTAGCTFQDSLARQRASQGENAVSLDVGWMRTVGIIAETKDYQRNRQSQDNIATVETEELLGLIGEVCKGRGAKQSPQVIIGAVTPADMLRKKQTVPTQLQQPMFSGFSQVAAAKEQSKQSVESGPAVLFEQAATPRDRAQVVVQAVAARLARALGVSPDDIEPAKVLSDFGVDSLMAVELRNWIGKEFKANVAVFDIMGGLSVSGLGNLVAERTEVGV
jgi:acyl transferase domain-containing protein/NADPH:quinone reductase-like Zn-dependent oxidoreductase/NAD(P)-dependent dehydrogenase (short-subunit alcohol dehydrogenase family)/SAM-dependent methyltransferase/acyl carrier protein